MGLFRNVEYIRRRRGAARKASGGTSGSRRQNRQDATNTGKQRQQKSKRGETSGSKAARKKDAEDSAKKVKDDKKNMAAMAALGIGAAAAAALVATALASFVASDGAEIRFTSIRPNITSAGFVPSWFSGIVPPTRLEITWEVVKPGDPLGIPSEVRVIKGDEIDISETGLEKIDGQTVKVVDVKDDKTFIIESKMSSTSDVSVDNKGKGIIHTSFDDQLEQNVDDAVDTVGGFFDKLSGGFFSAIGTILFVVFIVVIGWFLYTTFKPSSSKPVNSVPNSAAQ